MHRTLLAAAVAAPLALSAQQGTLRAEHALALPRVDEIVALPRAAVRQGLAAAAPPRVRALDASRREIASRVVDGDGTPDELILQATFWPNEAKDFTLDATAPTMAYAPNVFARHDDPRDDVAWERDRIAWRVYGEGLNPR